MVIYLIRNKLNGKNYIGQTINSFKERYDGSGRWWKSKTINAHLRNAAKLYGPENFEIRILEEGVKTEEELNRLEIEYIRLYQSLYPKGYNYQAGGQFMKNRGHHEMTVMRLSANGASKGEPMHLLNNTEMKIYEFTNITRFARQMGLQVSLVFNMLRYNKRAKHLRWSRIEHPIKRFNIRHTDGRDVIIFDGELKAFCRKNLIRAPQYFLRMLKKETPSCKGWSLVRTYTPSGEGLEVIKLKQYDLPD